MKAKYYNHICKIGHLVIHRDYPLLLIVSLHAHLLGTPFPMLAPPNANSQQSFTPDCHLRQCKGKSLAEQELWHWRWEGLLMST